MHTETVPAVQAGENVQTLSLKEEVWNLGIPKEVHRAIRMASIKRFMVKLVLASLAFGVIPWVFSRGTPVFPTFASFVADVFLYGFIITMAILVGILCLLWSGRDWKTTYVAPKEVRTNWRLRKEAQVIPEPVLKRINKIFKNLPRARIGFRYQVYPADHSKICSNTVQFFAERTLDGREERVYIGAFGTKDQKLNEL